MTSTVGMLEAVTSAIGEADAEIGGIRITRLTAPVTDGVVLSATYTWAGTTTVLSGDTSEVAVGDFIRLDVDGQYFEITGITPNVSVTLDNPESLVIPTGTSQSSKAVTSLPVESTLEFADVGKVACNGVVYYYGSKTDQSFDEITHLVGGVSVAGVQRLHRIEAAVYDRNRDDNALDLVRRAMLVEYAEGEDLNALGRNLGVFRSAFLTGDDQFREIIKVLAYNPKGTLYGLQLALTGLVGEGNFQIYEDLINNPAKVFISLTAAAILASRAQGAAYLSENEIQPADSLTQVTVDHEVISKGDVRTVALAPEALMTPTTSAYPSAQTWEPYPGATPVAQWTAFGAGEGTTGQIVTTDGGALEWAAGGATLQYYRDSRLIPETQAVMSMWLRPLDNGVGGGATADGNMAMGNGTKEVAVGWRQNGTGGGATWEVGFINGSYAFLSGFYSVPIDGLYHEVRIEHDPDGERRLYWDGALIQTLDGSLFTNNSAHGQWFGYPLVVPANAPEWRMKDVRWDLRTCCRDYWSAEATDGSVSAGTRILSSAALTFLAGDVGNGFTTRNSQVTNGQGGNNNGRWIVEAQGGTNVTLIGYTWTGATLQGANPDRVLLPTDQQLLKFPDDLGKEIEIIGSELGNDGVYVIDKLLDPDTLTDIELGASPQSQYTNVCEVVSGGFVSETDLSFRLRPNFAAETNLEWVLNDAGSIASNVLTLRQGLPASLAVVARVFEVVYGQVLSAQLLRDAEVQNQVTSLIPLEFAYWPFYLADPLGYARDYLSSVTAAGVIPDFTLE